METEIRRLRELTSKIVEAMGGDPKKVCICWTKEETDAFISNGFLFFNVARKDSPFRWFGVVARELAYYDRRSHLCYYHIKLMIKLIAKGMQNLDMIFKE